MAINNVKDTQSLLHDIEDWMDNPKFQPQEQNKWFFGEGLSYYTQLCEVVKVLTYLQENFKIVIGNEKSLEQAYNEVKDLPSQFTVLSNRVDELSNTVSDLPTRVQELETKVTKLISDVSSQLTRIETLEGNVGTNTNDITTIKTDITNIKTKDSQQDVKIEKLQSDVVSINAKDISQDNEIESIKNKNKEQDTLIDKNTSGITELKNANYLKELVLQNSATISFTGGIKENGVQTYTGQVTGSIPANLTENLAFSNNNVTPIVYGVSSNDIIEQEKYIATAISTQSINNGISNNSTIPVSKFNNNHFEKNTTNIISIKNSVLEPYETKANASTTYETKANASTTYETKANASSTYVSKTDAVGYDDILTKTEASGEYETKANASTTYVSKTEAVGYDDILTNANASTTYETKAHATETYPTKTEMTNAINSAIGTAINSSY